MSITETKTSVSGLDLKSIPTDYKRTELGFIPEEWSIVTLRDICVDMLQGINTAIDKPEYSYSGVPILKANNVIDKVISLSNMEYVTKRSYAKYNQRYHVKKGDFLFSNIGARLGTGALWEHDIEATFAWNVMRIIPDTKKVYPRFLAQLINSPKQSEKIQGEQSGSGMGFIPKSIMQKVVLPFPPISEQTAIANALSDVDALIQELEKLIAKKQAIKTATMQQLLTGRTRLPAFAYEKSAHHPDGRKKGYKPSELGEIPEDWEDFCFSDLAKPRSTRINPRVSGGGDFCIELEHLGSGSGTIVGNTETHRQSSLKSIFDSNDILFGKLRAYLQKYWLADRSGVCSTEIWVFKAEPKIAMSRFVFYIVQTDEFISAASEAYGTHMPRADWSVVKEFRVATPSLEEQTAIATILSNMDAEIQLLERNLNKTRQIKQGMMQELLTGKTRLVKPAEPA